MVRSIGAQLGLFAFGVAILAGLYAGNSPVTILVRAMASMVAACIVGQLLGWAGKQVLRDHLQKKKLTIDRQHDEVMQAIAARQEENEATTEAEPVQVG